jgi:hypothetical protein
LDTGEPDEAKVSRPVRREAVGKVPVTGQLVGGLPYYDLHEPLPEHSSLTRIRERFGLEVFRSFFERIVEECVEARLVCGEELYFDATKVEANASLESGRSRSLVEGRLEEYLAGVFPENTRPPMRTKSTPQSSPASWDPMATRGRRLRKQTG